MALCEDNTALSLVQECRELEEMCSTCVNDGEYCKGRLDTEQRDEGSDLKTGLHVDGRSLHTESTHHSCRGGGERGVGEAGRCNTGSGSAAHSRPAVSQPTNEPSWEKKVVSPAPSVTWLHWRDLYWSIS